MLKDVAPKVHEPCTDTYACKFYKTEKQFEEDNDRAIDFCRETGRCERCKYVASGEYKVPCRKSSEKK